MRFNLGFSWPAVLNVSSKRVTISKRFFLKDMLFAEANAYRIQCLRNIDVAWIYFEYCYNFNLCWNIGMKLSSGKQVGMGIAFFLNFAPKHRLWVLVRTASARRSEREPTIYVCVLFSVETFSIITT